MPNQTSKFNNLITVLNQIPKYKYLTQGQVTKSMTAVTKRTYKQYLALLRKAGYITKDGRGSTAMIIREKRIPKVKLNLRVIPSDK